MHSLKIVVLAVLLAQLLALSVNDFKPALFHTSQPSGFYSVETGSPNSGEILALADLNGDKYTDYVATNNRSLPTLSFYYWNDQTSTFALTEINLTISGDLQEVMVCDINADGSNEFVVTFLANSSFYTQVYSTNCVFTCNIELWPTSSPFLSGMSTVPFIFDRFSNGSVSIFTFGPSGQRTVLSVIPNKKDFYAQTWSTMVNGNPSITSPASKHFASMIDINGDCFSDIVLVSGSNNNLLEFYTKNQANNFVYSSVDLGKSIFWLSFADIDANGATDLLFMTNSQPQFSLYIIHNVNTPSEICQAFGQPSFQLSQMQRINIPSTHILLSDSNLKIADFNFDGYPDLLGIFSVGTYRKATILINQKNLNFAVFDANLEPLHQVSNPLQTCLYDFTESGKISILVISNVSKSDGSLGLPRTSIINNVIEDTLFIKILSLLPSSSDDFESKALINSIGVTIEWRITNLDGDKTISVLNQKSQWNFGSLQPPFSTSGLGRTNNYIEDLTVGYSGYGLINSWTPVIPNSQLILLGREQQDEWVLQTLLKDNSRVYDMIYISILCLLGMGLLILFLNWRENQQDKRDHYNFIQMIR